MDDKGIYGLGDLVEVVLTKLGITEDRFKRWFRLKDCECSYRKDWLNKLWSWGKRNRRKRGSD